MVLDNPAIPESEVAKIRQGMAAVHPLNRMGEPIEVANLILYLASNESSFTSGSEHVIDGGLLATGGYAQHPFAGKM